jgi:hypothetical protein
MCANLLGWFQDVEIGWVGDTGYHERHGINRRSRGGHQGVFQAGLARRSYSKVRTAFAKWRWPACGQAPFWVRAVSDSLRVEAWGKACTWMLDTAQGWMPGPGIEVLAHPRGEPARSVGLLLLVLLVAARLGPVDIGYF